MLTIEQSSLILQTYLEITADPDGLVREFYGTLVDLAPSLASTFTSNKASYETLKTRLMEFIRLSFEALQNPAARSYSIPLLTRHYLALGVRGEDYIAFGSAMVAAMTSRQISTCPREMQTIYTEFYGLLAQIACDEPSPHLFTNEAA